MLLTENSSVTQRSFPIEKSSTRQYDFSTFFRRFCVNQSINQSMAAKLLFLIFDL